MRYIGVRRRSAPLQVGRKQRRGGVSNGMYGKASDGDACCDFSSLRRVLSSSEWSDSKHLNRHSPLALYQLCNMSRANQPRAITKIIFISLCP